MITIEDNGTGLEKRPPLSTFSKEGHYGLVGIDERVKLLGGRLRIQNNEDAGLMLQAEIPHPRNWLNQLISTDFPFASSLDYTNVYLCERMQAV